MGSEMCIRDSDNGVCRHCSFVACAEVWIISAESTDLLALTQHFERDGAKLALVRSFGRPGDAKLALDWRLGRPDGAKLALDERSGCPGGAKLALEQRFGHPQRS